MNSMMNVTDLWFIFLYLLSLILIGFYGKQRNKDHSLKEFYLGGSNYGFMLLFLTFYATQYSGNSIIGFSGKAYREGWITLSTVVFMVVIIAGFLSYAPKLYPLAKKRNYITLGDYIHDRYHSKVLHYLVIAISIFVLSNYVLTNLKAMGDIVSSISNGQISAMWGIITLAIIIFIYESLGGMRSVVLTDAIQGVLLFITIQIIFFIIIYQYGFNPISNIEVSSESISPIPNSDAQIKWISTIFLIFFSIAVYPHAIQRIFMAKDTHSLKKSFKLMLIMPFFTTLPIILIAIIGIEAFPNLSTQNSEHIIVLMLGKITHLPFMHWIIVLFFAAALAAIMSTIDSSNMAINAMVIKDIYLKFQPNSSQKKTALLGRLFSLILIAFLSYLAIEIEASIWAILKIKLGVLAQLFPMIVLGLWVKSIQASSVLYGLITGLALVIYLSFFSAVTNPLNIHAGLWALLANFMVLYLSEKIRTFLQS